ncbi:MAG: GNAT family N-acetyltransferase [bacterium]|nr:GNAT family N-acetyltransferase [bacterium]
MPLHISRARFRHSHNICTGIVEAFACHPWFEELSFAEAATRWVETTRRRGFHCLVATQDHRLVGAIWWDSPAISELKNERGTALAAFAVRHLERNTTLVWIRDLIVLPDRQGQGIGHQLRQKMIEHCVSKNSVLFLTRIRNDNTSMIRMNHAMGFLRSGITVPCSLKPDVLHEYWYLLKGAFE